MTDFTAVSIQTSSINYIATASCASIRRELSLRYPLRGYVQWLLGRIAAIEILYPSWEALGARNEANWLVEDYTRRHPVEYL